VHLRHDRTWVKEHFVDPEKLSPGSGMLPFDNLTPVDLDAITDYVMAIPK
jgi:cbb3-type cytochrome oxidase cytochrome c subunit